jgi:hypothetical protein
VVFCYMSSRDRNIAVLGPALKLQPGENDIPQLPYPLERQKHGRLCSKFERRAMEKEAFSFLSLSSRDRNMESPYRNFGTRVGQKQTSAFSLSNLDGTWKDSIDRLILEFFDATQP